MNILQKHRNTYHKSESRLHHHSLIVAVGVALFATMAARNIADTLGWTGDTYAQTINGDVSISTNVYPAEFEAGQEVAILMYYNANIEGTNGAATIDVELPINLTYQSANIEYDSVSTSTNGLLTYTRNNITNNAEVIVIQAVGTDDAEGSGNVVGQVYMPGLAEQDIGNNVDSISITQIASELLSENLADLWIKKTSPAETLRAGEDINYTIEYGNSGSSGVQDTFVFDILPEGLTFISANPSPTLREGNSLRWDVGELSDNTTGVISIQASSSLLLSSGFTLYNIASIESISDELTQSNNLDEFVTTISQALPELSLSKIADTEQIEVGQELTYTYIFENNGGGPAGDVVISDTYPTGYAYVSSTLTPTIIDGSYFREIENIQPGQQGLIELVVIPNTAGIIDNDAMISYEGFQDQETDTDNNISSFAVEIFSIGDKEDQSVESDDGSSFSRGNRSLPCFSLVGKCDENNTISTHLVAETGITIQETYDDTFTQEYYDAFAYSKFLGYSSESSNIRTIGMFKPMARHQLAKLMVTFVAKELGRKPDLDKACIFSDTASMPTQVSFYTTKACQYGLMGVGIDAFDPLAPIDRATVGTVFSRALFGGMFDRHTDNRYSEHLRVLKHLGVMNRIDNYTELMLHGDSLLMTHRLTDSGLAAKIAEKLYSK